MSSLIVEVCSSSDRWTLDFANEESLRFVLQRLDTHGIVVLKRATEHSPTETQAEYNKFITALLRVARDGAFRVSLCKAFEFVANAELQHGRSPDWEELGKEPDITGFGCYHLGGRADENWRVTYDTALRGKPTNRLSIVDACGGDIVLFNGWLARSSPSPTFQDGKAVVVHYIWNGYKK
ncbi:hypothetical protein DM02DRAFT_620937 [Periconia macrospinosa]|uniref:Uncharacterized protein n=1 Tax=Periconia macrospinosa TaxID=97972 RepID=A0A2V1CXZ4_9PLEO|nr:hypothetical protein DM02DRAFT_620937 [Periconia macrospinosa]